MKQTGLLKQFQAIVVAQQGFGDFEIIQIQEILPFRFGSVPKVGIYHQFLRQRITKRIMILPEKLDTTLPKGS